MSILDTTDLMDVLIHCVWHVKVHHKSDIDKVESSAEYSGTDHHFKVSIQKTLQTNCQSFSFFFPNLLIFTNKILSFLDKCDIITVVIVYLF